MIGSHTLPALPLFKSYSLKVLVVVWECGNLKCEWSSALPDTIVLSLRILKTWVFSYHALLNNDSKLHLPWTILKTIHAVCIASITHPVHLNYEVKKATRLSRHHLEALQEACFHCSIVQRAYRPWTNAVLNPFYQSRTTDLFKPYTVEFATPQIADPALDKDWYSGNAQQELTSSLLPSTIPGETVLLMSTIFIMIQISVHPAGTCN